MPILFILFMKPSFSSPRYWINLKLQPLKPNTAQGYFCTDRQFRSQLVYLFFTLVLKKNVCFTNLVMEISGITNTCGVGGRRDFTAMLKQCTFSINNIWIQNSLNQKVWNFHKQKCLKYFIQGFLREKSY